MKKFIALTLITAAFATVSLASADTFTLPQRQLGIGARGEDVAGLQKALASDASLYPAGLITGVYGPLTAQAIARFQAKYGLPAVGRVGPKTIVKLQEIFGTSTASSTVCQAGDKFNTATGEPCGVSIQAFLISSTTVSDVTPTSATISWLTSASSTTKVLFATYPIVSGSSALMLNSDSLSTTHTVSLSNLNSSTLYYVIISSTDPRGVTITSSPFTFTTPTR